jgi:hypothetical protein
MHRYRIAAAGAAALLFVLATAGPAIAHEERTVGAYKLAVGWQAEPAYAGFPNAVQVFVTDANGSPVADLGNPPSIKVEVTTGTQKSDPFVFKPSFDPDRGFGTKGEFDAPILPTRPGVYTFRVFGTVNGRAVDAKFTSSDTTFNSVQEPANVEFPVKDPSPGQLATNIERISPRVDAAATTAKSAKDKASSANTLAVVALVVGVVLGGAGLATGLAARRRG